jgi:CDP-diglyceride synthetase
VKRRARVKDSGVLMGASGGVLDVLDSLLLTVPLAWLVLPALAAGAN